MSALPYALRRTCCCCCWFTCFVILIRPVLTVTNTDNALTNVKQYNQGVTNNIWIRQRRYDYSHRQDHGEIQPAEALTGVKDGVYEDTDPDLSYDGDEDDEYPDTNITGRTFF